MEGKRRTAAVSCAGGMRAEELRVRSVALWPSSIICNAGVTRSDYPYLDPNSVILLLEGTVESGKRTESILRIQSHVIGPYLGPINGLL